MCALLIYIQYNIYACSSYATNNLWVISAAWCINKSYLSSSVSNAASPPPPSSPPPQPPLLIMMFLLLLLMMMMVNDDYVWLCAWPCPAHTPHTFVRWSFDRLPIITPFSTTINSIWHSSATAHHFT